VCVVCGVCVWVCVCCGYVVWCVCEQRNIAHAAPCDIVLPVQTQCTVHKAIN